MYDKILMGKLDDDTVKVNNFERINKLHTPFIFFFKSIIFKNKQNTQKKERGGEVDWLVDGIIIYVCTLIVSLQESPVLALLQLIFFDFNKAST